MQLPLLTQDQVQERCTAQSFKRGLEYYREGAIGNPVLLDYKLSANCQGTEVYPYRVSVEFMPTGIATAYCSCPYSWDGDCKHIVALLLTYIKTPETVFSVDSLLTTLETKFEIKSDRHHFRTSRTGTRISTHCTSIRGCRRRTNFP